MKRLAKTVVLFSVLVALGSEAMADGRRGHEQWRPREARGGGDWIAPLIFVGIAGAMLGAAAAQPSVPAQSIQPMPQAPLAHPMPPANAQYYCRSAGQYYPYTQYCPEGWQLAVPGY